MGFACDAANNTDYLPFVFSLLSRTLIAACADNDVNTVRRLLGDGSNTINEGTDDGESLLSLACSAGYYELAQVLLAMSAQVEDRGQKNDCTPLMEAASAGHVDIIRLLISHNADVNALSSTGNTPLMYACAGGHVRAVKELLASGANVEDHNENGHTPLMEAASAGHVEVAKVSTSFLPSCPSHCPRPPNRKYDYTRDMNPKCVC